MVLHRDFFFRSPQSPLHLHCNGKGTKILRAAQIIRSKTAFFEGYFPPLFCRKIQSVLVGLKSAIATNKRGGLLRL
jgi:hypothetical protein